MEVKINKEIFEYRENLFFGLSARQFICAALAVGAAVGVFMLASDSLGDEIASWLCIAVAAPLAAAGFVRYNGMTLEQLVVEVIKSNLIYPRRRVYQTEGIYEILLDGRGHRDESNHGREAAQNPPHGATEHPNTAHLSGEYI